MREVPKKMRFDLSDAIENAIYRKEVGLIVPTPEAILAPLPKCNHRKGGFAASERPEDIKRAMEKGDSIYHSVIHHRLPHGGVMVLCTRCQKEWHPANPTTGEPATDGWADAVEFLTDNQPSGSSRFFVPTKVVFQAPVKALCN